MSNSVTIQAAPQASVVNATDRVPISQGDGLPKTATVQQIFDLTSGYTAAAVATTEAAVTQIDATVLGLANNLIQTQAMMVAHFAFT